MGIGIDDEHVAFARVLDQALHRMSAFAATRAALDDGACGLPDLWPEAAAQGWLGLHLPEAVGGSGAGLLEACLVMEAVGAHCAPGPFLPAILSSAA